MEGPKFERTPVKSSEQLPNRSEREMDEEISFILDQHNSLRDKWEKLVEGLPLPQQLERLEDLARKRREALAPKPYVSPNLQVLETFPERAESLFSEAIKTLDERSREVDRGWNGRIMEFVEPGQEESNLVYKLLIRSPIGEQNDLLSEASYLADLYEIASLNSDVRVGVPRPFYCATAEDARVIAMQKVPGVSIENITTKNIPIPAGFDINELENELKDFVRRMNGEHFYHNDLRPGNIMVNLERKSPEEPIAYIIDTGSAKYAYDRFGLEHAIDKSPDLGMMQGAVQILREYRARQQ